MPPKSASVQRASGKTSSSAGPAEARDYVLRINLEGSQPPIWRRVQVPGSFTLGDLHSVIQAVFDWENCHLHVFTVGNTTYGPESDEGFGDEDENSRTLSELFPRAGKKFHYEYDFGDSWVHRITVEKILPADPDQPRLPTCLTGRMAAPPEDSGGIYGYMEKIEALSNPKESGLSREEIHEIREWMGKDFDPAQFSVSEANRKLQAVFGAKASARPAKGNGKKAKKTPGQTTGRKATGKPARKEDDSECVWAGTVIDVSSVTGPAGSASGKTPVLAIWFDVTDPRQVYPVSFCPGYDDAPEHPLIQALFRSEPGSRRPTRLVAATQADLEILRNHSFEGMSVASETMPEIAENAHAVVSEVARAASQIADQAPELQELVPVPGEPDVDEDLSRAWCEAALAFWKARPWKKTHDENLFELTFPDGEVRIATLMGHSRESYGFLLFASEEDYQGFYDFARQAIDSDTPLPVEKLPPILSLNFDDPDYLPPAVDDYLSDFGPQWKRQSTRPFVITGGMEMHRPSARDFILTAQAATAFAHLAQKKTGWPPRPGAKIQVDIPWLGQTARLQMRTVRG